MLVIVYRERDGEIAAVERVNEAHARGHVGRSLGELVPLWEKEGLRAIALPDEVHPVVHRVERSPAGLAVVERWRRNEEGLEVAPPERPWYVDLREVLREERERERERLRAARSAAMTGELLWGDLTSLANQGFRRCISDCLLRGRGYERPAVTKKVSVIVPCFNMGKFLETAIESALNDCQLPTADCRLKNEGDAQSAIGNRQSAMEVIVVAQGCTDESVEVARKYAAKDERVRVVEAPLNLGAAFARNWGILHAQGEWYGFLDADDAYETGAIGALLRAGEEAQQGASDCGLRNADCGLKGEGTEEGRNERGQRVEVRGQERQQRIQHPTLNIQHPTFKDEVNGNGATNRVRNADAAVCRQPVAHEGDCGMRSAECGLNGNTGKSAIGNSQPAIPVVVHGRSRAWEAGMERALYEEPWRGEVTAGRLREQCCFVPGCMLAHESVFWKAGVWWAEFWQRIEDYEWQAAALGRVRFVYLDQVVLRKRETGESRAKWPVQSEWSRELRNLLQGWLRR